jgi:hypothetical protein
MKCPEYIRVAINKRAQYADKTMLLDNLVASWIEKHGIEVEDYDIRGGTEIYVNPYESAQRLLEAIANKESEEENIN